MSVAASDLLAPTGPVESALFPGESVDTIEQRLNSYISQSVAKAAGYSWGSVAEEDAGVTAWALYLTFRQAHTLSLMRPAENNFEIEVLGRTIFEEDQRTALKEISDMYLSEWGILSDAAGTGAGTISTGIPSHQSRNVYDW